MAHKIHTSVSISEIRKLATRFCEDDIALCQERVLRGKDNVCYSDPNPEELMNVLAKAGFVRSQVQRGFTMKEAIRELGKRMRMLKGK